MDESGTRGSFYTTNDATKPLKSHFIFLNDFLHLSLSLYSELQLCILLNRNSHFVFPESRFEQLVRNERSFQWVTVRHKELMDTTANIDIHLILTEAAIAFVTPTLEQPTMRCNFFRVLGLIAAIWLWTRTRAELRSVTIIIRMPLWQGEVCRLAGLARR